MPTIEYRQEFWLPGEPERVWREIERFDRYELWWSWLRRFRAERPGIVPGNVLEGLVVPPVPYPFRLRVTVVECVRPTSVTAELDGDVRGGATMSFDPAGAGTRVACSWTLHMTSVPMRAAAITAFPLVRWGHDRVVQMTVQSFVAHALNDVVAAPRL